VVASHARSSSLLVAVFAIIAFLAAMLVPAGFPDEAERVAGGVFPQYQAATSRDAKCSK